MPSNLLNKNPSIANHREAAPSILSHLSYAALTPKDKSVVEELFTHYKHARNQDHLKNAFQGLSREVFRKKYELSESVEIFSQRLSTLNPASINYLKDSQKKALRQELLFGFYLLSAQFYLHQVENNKQFLRQIAAQIEKTTSLIGLINCKNLKGPQSSLADALNNNDKLCKYLGIPLGQKIADEVITFADSKTDNIEQFMATFNERRLFWVWGEDVVDYLLLCLPESFSKKQNAQASLHAPDKILGAVGWSLYYTRFSIELGLLLKHTLTGRWMNEEESLIPSYERFKSQWQQRKFLMLNDFAWATVNLVTYFWLIGRGFLGYLGDVITVSLLVFDASVTLWSFMEEDALHNQLMMRFDNDIEALKKKQGDDNPEVKHQLRSLRTKRNQVAFDWKYKKYHLALDLTYAIGLITTYAMACSFLLPPHLLQPATSFIIGMTGSALCLVITIAYTVAAGLNDVNKTQATLKTLQQGNKELLTVFKEAKDADIQKLIYLDLLQNVSQGEYHNRMINYQKMELVRGVLIDTMIPALVFLTLLYFPLGVGLGVLGAGLALMATSKMILKQFEPQSDTLPRFDEKVYKKFLENPSIEEIKTLPVVKQPLSDMFSNRKANAPNHCDEDLDDPSLLNH